MWVWEFIRRTHTHTHHCCIIFIIHSFNPKNKYKEVNCMFYMDDCVAFLFTYRSQSLCACILSSFSFYFVRFASHNRCRPFFTIQQKKEEKNKINAIQSTLRQGESVCATRIHLHWIRILLNAVLLYVLYCSWCLHCTGPAASLPKI